MKDPKRSTFFYGILAIFSAITLSGLLFFLLIKLPQIRDMLKSLSSILAPIIYGGVIAYLLRPICNWTYALLKEWFPKLKDSIADTIAIAVSLVIGILVVYALIAILAPRLYDSVVSIWNTLPEKADQFIAFLNNTFAGDNALVQFFETSSDTIYTAIDSWFKTTIVPNLTNIVSGVGMSVWKVLLFLKNFLIGMIVAIYFLASRKKFKRQANMLLRCTLRPQWAQAVAEEAAFVDQLFGGFLSGKILDSAIIGILCYIGCSILRFPDALLVSAIVGVTNIIPFFGPFIGGIPSALLIFLEDPIKGLWFVLFIIVLQQLDGNIIGPKILGNRTGLSSFWVLFSIVLFGGLWGLVGMVIGVPLMAVIYDLISKFVRRRLQVVSPEQPETEGSS